MNEDQPEPWEFLAFPHIARACFTIAIDNGGINRERGAHQWAADYTAFINSRMAMAEELPKIDSWLADLSAEELDTVCTGEAGEADSILARGPVGARDILDDYFDLVC